MVFKSGKNSSRLIYQRKVAMKYIKVPNEIDFSELKNKNFSLSSAQYKQIIMKNDNFITVRDFFIRPLTRRDLGREVGSVSYINQSPYYFLRTKALQSDSFLPDITKESVIPILPKMFEKMNLSEGDLLISKDSNIGEAVILGKDYPDFMLSGAIYRLPIKTNKYYLLAFLKHDICREQLDFMTPKSATIRHAKTLFADIKIPLPQKNKENIIRYIEILTQSVINKEKEIQRKHCLIYQRIEQELKENQKPDKFLFDYPSNKEIADNSYRLDIGLYSETYKETEFLIKNYSNGYFQIDKKNIRSGNTPEKRYIGTLKDLKFRWVTPTTCSDYGFLGREERISFKSEKNNLRKNCMLLVNRTSRGGRGEFVGIANFYNIQEYGLGHHNQGIYQVFDYPDNQLIFMTLIMNSPLLRKYCACHSVGSKMKEMKTNQFLQIPFPIFPEQKQNEIVELYHNSTLDYKTTNCKLDNFLETDCEFNKQAGIYELDKTAKKLKAKLNQAIDDIINDKNIDISFEF